MSLEAQPRPAQGEASREPVGAPLATVLVVDDEATVRRVLQMRLELAGYRVLCAVDGEEALTPLPPGAAGSGGSRCDAAEA